MPSFTSGYPERTGNPDMDEKAMFDWACSLIDELRYVLSNIDEYNISDNYTNYIKEISNGE